MSLQSAVLITICAALASPVTQGGFAARPRPTAPETFVANALVVDAGSAAAVITMKIDHYSADTDRDAVTQALQTGGYTAFLEALRKAPVVGTLTMAGQTIDIRWARQEVQQNSRTITLVTDKPAYFVGGGSISAKPREGYDVALLRFRIDDAGLGYDGTMAAAARVKAGGATGVEVDDYGQKPIALKTISRAIR
jgi:hypothetical protein